MGELWCPDALSAFAQHEDLAAGLQDMLPCRYALDRLIESQVERVSCRGGDDCIERLGDRLEQGLAQKLNASSVRSHSVSAENSCDLSRACERYIKHEIVPHKRCDFQKLRVQGVFFE